MTTDNGNLDILLRLLEAKRNDAEWQREEQRKQLEKARKMKQLKQLQDEIKGIEAESTQLVQEWENIDVELESFNLAEVRGKCTLFEIVIYELAVLDY